MFDSICSPHFRRRGSFRAAHVRRLSTYALANTEYVLAPLNVIVHRLEAFASAERNLHTFAIIVQTKIRSKVTRSLINATSKAIGLEITDFLRTRILLLWPCRTVPRVCPSTTTDNGNLSYFASQRLRRQEINGESVCGCELYRNKCFRGLTASCERGNTEYLTNPVLVSNVSYMIISATRMRVFRASIYEQELMSG